MVSSCGNYTYHVAIIDYLQSFNFDKRLESWFKTFVRRRSYQLISAVDPKTYGDRFLKFMKNEVLIEGSLIEEDLLRESE